MPSIALAQSGHDVSVGRLSVVAGREDGGYQEQQPQRVLGDSEGGASFLSRAGSQAGRPADIKTSLHWLLVPEPHGNGFQLRPVVGWYNFDRPAVATLRTKSPGLAEDDDRAEAGMKAHAAVRHRLADRWKDMLSRAVLRVPGHYAKVTTRSQLLQESKSLDEDPALDEEVMKILQPLDTLEKLQQLQDLEVDKRRPQLSLPPLGQPLLRRRGRGSVEYPEEEEDATGLKTQHRRRRRARQRQEEGEDADAVPDTANRLLQLKSERGEGLWDFEDAERFDDDEQDQEDFAADERDEFAKDDEVPVLAPVEGEDEDLQSDSDVEAGCLQTSHGQELETLLERHGEEECDLSEREAAAGREAASLARLQERQRSADAGKSLRKRQPPSIAVAEKSLAEQDLKRQNKLSKKADKRTLNGHGGSIGDSVPAPHMQAQADASSARQGHPHERQKQLQKESTGPSRITETLPAQQQVLPSQASAKARRQPKRLHEPLLQEHRLPVEKRQKHSGQHPQKVQQTTPKTCQLTHEQTAQLKQMHPQQPSDGELCAKIPQHTLAIDPSHSPPPLQSLQQPQQRLQETSNNSSTDSPTTTNPTSAPAASSAPSIVSDQRPAMTSGRQQGSSSQPALGKLSAAASSQQTVPARVGSADGVSDADLRAKAVAALRDHGGACTLLKLAATLGLRNPKDPIWQQAVQVLREVADTEKMPGEAKTLLLLKPEHWGSVLKGPPAPCAQAGSSFGSGQDAAATAARPWSYLDSDGQLVQHRNRALAGATSAGMRYKAQVILAPSKKLVCWLPYCKAPETCPALPAELQK
eukprot:TRINITY_DN88233_c0_g1_i1.p1 TRINITY_DN88233_c0_g1~~TRINITY_DN88233_c0_g1_i1.p1  ORF type:complete len:811 (+),score=217.75 TRINITY_DN88233_c0_g1_i1:33-2465(+)